MYTINDQQIEFILSDIRRNGVEMEDLQLNLLDHLCCIIEQELEENGDFEQFYFTNVKKFYKKELREIEEETISLLINKNYYVMKKIMIVSGVTSVSLLTMGIALKFLHLQGASFGIVFGILMMSLIFLPLLFTLKIKEKKELKEKVLIGVGIVAGMSLSLGTLFKIMHWPWANNLSLASIVILMLIFVPIYFFTGIRNPDTKVNTIVSSLLIITGCGLFLTLVRSPYGSKMLYIQTTNNYLRNEQLLENEKQLLQQSLKKDSIVTPLLKMNKKINSLCDDLKTYIIKCETGHNSISVDFESHDAWLKDSQIGNIIEENPKANQNLETLKQSITDYNKGYSKLKLSLMQSIIPNINETRSSEALNGIIQIQMNLLQNERALLTSK